MSFLEGTIRGFTRALSRALVAEQTSTRSGLFQSFDPRVRLLSVLILILATTLCRRLPVIASLFVIAALLALASGIKLLSLLRRVWLIVFGFTSLIALPAVFITPGQPVITFPEIHATITAQGLRAAAMLILRVETAATLTTTLVLSTPWNHILKALRMFHLPVEVVAMLTMTHRYIFLLIETANQMFESRQSRLVGVISGSAQRAMTARTAGVLLSKSIDLSNEVYLAMMSRGFRGEIRLLNEFRLRSADYAGFALVFGTGCAAVWMGR
jgi:cobalt/nickel transport system permease protein